MANSAYWNGREIQGKLLIGGVETHVAADRDMIHSFAPGYSDALTWEIERFAEDILDRMKPYFTSAAQRPAG
jgi:hypothetical protein